jgi:hypothetical protein
MSDEEAVVDPLQGPDPGIDPNPALAIIVGGVMFGLGMFVVWMFMRCQS